MMPRVIDREIVGLYEHVTVETSPVLSDEQKEALYEWASENLLPWEWFDALNAEQTEWDFVIEHDPENYYDG